jgi:hypothetical protein
MDVHELNVQLDQKIAGMVKEAGKGLDFSSYQSGTMPIKMPLHATSWRRKLLTIIRLCHGRRLFLPAL